MNGEAITNADSRRKTRIHKDAVPCYTSEIDKENQIGTPAPEGKLGLNLQSVSF